MMDLFGELESDDCIDGLNLAHCIGCGCHDEHACSGGCWWLRVDYGAGSGVCSQCPAHTDRWDAGDRVPVGATDPAFSPEQRNASAAQPDPAGELGAGGVP